MNNQDMINELKFVLEQIDYFWDADGQFRAKASEKEMKAKLRAVIRSLSKCEVKQK